MRRFICSLEALQALRMAAGAARGARRALPAVGGGLGGGGGAAHAASPVSRRRTGSRLVVLVAAAALAAGAALGALVSWAHLSKGGASAAAAGAVSPFQAVPAGRCAAEVQRSEALERQLAERSAQLVAARRSQSQGQAAQQQAGAQEQPRRALLPPPRAQASPPVEGGSSGSGASAKPSDGRHSSRAGELSVVATSEDGRTARMASPSIVALPSGRLLVLYESYPAEHLTKYVSASDDGGVTWGRVATLGPMQWPQLFSCASGVYAFGSEREFSQNNNLVVSRMLDDRGEQWSAPAKVTEGMSVVTVNTGVDVSHGRVAKAFEVIPSLARSRSSAELTESLRMPPFSEDAVPILEARVVSTAGFIEYTLVKLPLVGTDRAVFFRVVRVDPARRTLALRPERFNLLWASPGGENFTAGETLLAGSGSMVYGCVDWVSMAISAVDEPGADLTLRSSWRLSAEVGNPAALYVPEVKHLLGAQFRADGEVRKGLLGFTPPQGLDDKRAKRWGMGGALYWMEGVVVRRRDSRSGDNSLLVHLRVNNDVQCNLGALTEFQDIPAEGEPEAGRFRGRFVRYTFAPGMATAHPAIVYDEVSDLYWLANNVVRDSLRAYRRKAVAECCQNADGLWITPYSTCEADRSTLGLWYSANGVDWLWAAVIDSHPDLRHHFTYPNMIVHGDDLLVVTRAHLGDRTHPLFSNHNSNAIAFHRVAGFRELADGQWAKLRGQWPGENDAVMVAP